MILYMTAPIESIAELYDNPRSYANAKSKLKRINELLHLEPTNAIHTEEYVRQFSRMCHLLMTETGRKGGQVKTKDQLTAYVGALVGAVTRTLDGERNPLKESYAKLKASDIPNPVLEHDAPPWSTLKQQLEEAFMFTDNDFGRMVALIYSYGYVLRIAELFNTTIKPMEGFNYLNLDTGEWTITQHKNKARSGARQFTIDKGLLDMIRGFVKRKVPYLIYKSTKEPYTVHTLAVIGLNDLPSCSQIRNSYEQWNWNQSKRTHEERLDWSLNVLGHKYETAIVHYTKNNINSELRSLRDLDGSE